MTKTISGRAYLQEMHYDLGIRLRENMSGEDLYKFIRKRIRFLEHHPAWIIIDWDTSAKPRQNDFELFGLFDIENEWPETDLYYEDEEDCV